MERFAGANLLTLALYAGLGGCLFFVPFDLIQVQGYSPASAGAAWLLFIVLVSAISRWAGGPRRTRGRAVVACRRTTRCRGGLRTLRGAWDWCALAGMDLPSDVTAALNAERTKLTAAEVPPALHHVLLTSYLAGFRAVMIVCSALAALGAFLAFALIESRPDPSSPRERPRS